MKKIVGYEIRSYPYDETERFYYKDYDVSLYFENEKEQLIRDYKTSLIEYEALKPKILLVTIEEVTWGL